VPATGLIKHILTNNFWAFLLVLSGIVDIGLGIVFYFSEGMRENCSPLTAFLICFCIGVFYLGIGILIGVRKRRKQT
jgi:uncharacterized membrane protein HdeD (DUF308 family)